MLGLASLQLANGEGDGYHARDSCNEEPLQWRLSLKNQVISGTKTVRCKLYSMEDATGATEGTPLKLTG